MRSALPRRVNAGIAVVLVLACFLDQPGRTTFDTKFDLTADPLSFLARSLQFWNPGASLGELQNQAYGYLFPQGAWFAFWQVIGLPDWITQRLWSGLVLVIAFEGARRLARAADITPWWAASLSGIAFALTPRVIAAFSTLSGEVLPSAVLPWVVLPVALAATHRMKPALAGALAGSATLVMGGLNAVENLATFPLPLLVAATAAASVRWRLLFATAAGLALASMWWMLPLLLLGRYSPPFLDYIETASATTGPLGFANLMRGADHWLQFFVTGERAWWPAGLALASDPLLILVTAMVAALGFAGLVGMARHKFPIAPALLTSAALGLALMYVAHDPRGGAWGSPIAGQMRDLLDGPLAAFRNVHKVDPLVRLPLAVGVGAIAAALARPSAWSWVAARRPSLARRVARVAAVLVASAVLLGGIPLWSGQARTPGYRAIPADWTEAASYLASHNQGGRALVVPGTGFGVQTWGVTMDEPLQGLATTPWVTRGQVPLAPPGTIRYLDALEQMVGAGVSDPGLAPALARAGIDHVVLRRDLTASETDAPPATVVAATLDRSPFIRKVQSSRLVDIYAVELDVPRVETVAMSSVLRMAGSPDDVVRALSAGAVLPQQPVVLREGGDDAPVGVVSDQYQRRERQFGRVHEAVGNTLSAADPWVLDRPQHDYAGPEGVRPLTLDGGEIASATASMSAASPRVLGPVRPELGPWSTVDGDPATLWRTAPLEDPLGSHVDLRFSSQQIVRSVEIDTESDVGSRAVTALDIQVGDVVRRTSVNPETGLAVATFPGIDATAVRVTVRGVGPHTGLSPREIGIREIRVGGVTSRPRLALPPTALSADAEFAFYAQPGRRPCLTTTLGPSCDVSLGRHSQADEGLHRTVTLPRTRILTVTGQATTRSTDAAAQLIEPVAGLTRAVRLRASSVYAGDPAVSGQRALDGNPYSAWLADPFDPNPRLRLSWPRQRTIDRIEVIGSGRASRSPSRVVIRAGDQRRTVDVRSGSLGFFRPLRTKSIEISFPGTDPRGLPVGVAELRIKGLRGLVHRIDQRAPTGGVCGFGPTVKVDGVAHRTRVSGQISDVLNASPLRLELCGRPLRLAAGRHHIDVVPSAWFAAQSVRLAAPGKQLTLPETRATRVVSWGETRRQVRVAAGAAAVLRVPENANVGWVATLDGRRLSPQLIDGWQQGWRVPAGSGGEVTLRFEPDSRYRLVLVLGAIAALVLLAAALGMADGRTRGILAETSTEARAGRVRRGHPWRRWLLSSGALALTWLGFGPIPVLAIAVTGAAAYVVRRRWPVRSTAIGLQGPLWGGMLLMTSAVVSAWAGQGSRAVNPAVADVCAGVALGLLLMAGWYAVGNQAVGNQAVGNQAVGNEVQGEE